MLDPADREGVRVPAQVVIRGARDLVASPAGLVAFRRTGTTSQSAYRVMRKSLTVAPRLAPRMLRFALPSPEPAPDRPRRGVLGDLTPADLAAFAATLRRDGFVRFDRLVDEVTCSALEAVARSNPARLLPAPVDGPCESRFDPDRPKAAKHDIPEPTIVSSPEAQGLLVDASLRAVAATYLGCAPVLTLSAMWWSSPSREGPSSEIAQLFHADRDHPEFLKFFLYLTDVDASHGPHVYVRGSHRRRPLGLRADRRFADDEVLRHYGPNDVVTICGPRGTLFAADTSGLHKGLPPVSGHRLVFQIEFARTLFGAPFTRIGPEVLTDDTVREMAGEPAGFERFLAPAG